MRTHHCACIRHAPVEDACEVTGCAAVALQRPALHLQPITSQHQGCQAMAALLTCHARCVMVVCDAVVHPPRGRPHGACCPPSPPHSMHQVHRMAMQAWEFACHAALHRSRIRHTQCLLASSTHPSHTMATGIQDASIDVSPPALSGAAPHQRSGSLGWIQPPARTGDLVQLQCRAAGGRMRR